MVTILLVYKGSFSDHLINRSKTQNHHTFQGGDINANKPHQSFVYSIFRNLLYTTLKIKMNYNNWLFTISISSDSNN